MYSNVEQKPASLSATPHGAFRLTEEFGVGSPTENTASQWPCHPMTSSVVVVAVAAGICVSIFDSFDIFLLPNDEM